MRVEEVVGGAQRGMGLLAVGAAPARHPGAVDGALAVAEIAATGELDPSGFVGGGEFGAIGAAVEAGRAQAAGHGVLRYLRKKYGKTVPGLSWISMDSYGLYF